MYMHLHRPLSSHDSLPPSLRRRAGHNGQQSSAVLCEEFRSEKINISKDMLEYCIQGKSCRRALLYSYFDSNVTDVSGCSCCDACAKSCMCIDCKCTSFPICLK